MIIRMAEPKKEWQTRNSISRAFALILCDVSLALDSYLADDDEGVADGLTDALWRMVCLCQRLGVDVESILKHEN